MSTDTGILRGASLRSPPLELGIKIGSIVANNTANAAATGALQPVTTAAQNTVQPYQLGGPTQAVATSAYDSSGAPEKIGQVNETYAQKRELSHQPAQGESSENVRLVGDEDGPRHPFPIQLTSKVMRGTGRSQRNFGMPTANLGNVAEDMLLPLSGVYAAWAKVTPPKKLKDETISNELYDIWHPSVVTVAPVKSVQASVVEKRSVSVYLINNFGDATFFDCKMNVMLMGFVRSVDQSTPGDPILRIARDIDITRRSLSRPAWQPDTLLERIETEYSSRSFTERMADAREAGQKQVVDKVPVHWLGVRTESMGLKDRLIGNGGICVKRL